MNGQVGRVSNRLGDYRKRYLEREVFEKDTYCLREVEEFLELKLKARRSLFYEDV